MKNSGKPHSISRRVAVSLALMIALVSAVMVAFMYFYASRAESSDLEKKADEQLLYLSGSLELPLWNEDKDTAALIAKTVFQNDLLATLKISDAFGNTLAEMDRGSEAERVARAGRVFHQGTLVGEIRLSLSSKGHRERTRSLLESFAFAVLLIVACLMLLSGLVVRALLRRPLDDLNRIVEAYAAGSYETSFAPTGCIEFQAVGDVLAKMGGKISGQLEQLKAAERRYRSIFENATEGIFQTSLEGSILNGNPALAGILGYSSAQELLSSVGDIAGGLYVEGEQRDKLLSLLFERESVSGYETRFRRRDGRVIWVSISARLVRDETGAPHVIEGFLTDVTVRKQSEQALQESRQRMDNIVANSPGAIYRCANDPEWTMEFLSAAITQITGYRADDFLNNRIRSYASIIHPDDRGIVERAVSDALERKERYEVDYRLVAADGTPRWVHEQGRGVFAPDGQLLCLDGVIFDISDQRKAEEEIRELNQQLEQRVSERTAQLEAANKELEAFAYSVSHDLRSPLRAIDGFSNILLEDYEAKLDAEGRRLLGVVRDNTHRMGMLIDDILKFSRAGRLEFSFVEIDMEALAHEVYAELQTDCAASNLSLEIEAIPPVQGDRAMMRQVFANLLSNAIKFSRPIAAPEIKVGSFVAGSETVYFVRDNGVGFDMQYAGKLFGVFQRLHNASEFEGTGIGLAIVKRIVTRHGGRVWAEAKVGEGATIYFSLPHAGDSKRETI